MEIDSKIYYYKEFDPRLDSKLKKLWFALRDEKDRVFVSRGFFRKNWVELPYKEKVVSKTLRADLESIFAKYNMGSNPLSSQKGQDFLKMNGLHHTSMSVGDVIKAGHRYFIVANRGFKRLVLTKY